MTRLYDLVVMNHRQLEECHEKLVKSGTAEEMAHWKNEFVWEIARQTVAENMVLYPALEKLVDDSSDLTDKNHRSQKPVKNLLGTFEETPTSSPDFVSQLQRLWTALTQHFKEEEDGDLKKLEDALSQQESADLAKAFERTKYLIPTRACLDQPEQPLAFATPTALLLAPLDQVRNVLRKLPNEE